MPDALTDNHRNYPLNQLEQLMVSVQHHDITFIVFTVIALLFLGAILWFICCLLETRHDLRTLDKRFTEGHNKLAAHPTTFITYNRSNCDWYYTGSSSTDNTRWQSAKTIYDPCPPGWRVPDGGSNGVWSKAAGSSSSFSGYPYDDTNKGMNLSGKFGSASTIWYPAAGYLGTDDGSLNYVGRSGHWWSCTPNGFYAYYLLLNYNGSGRPSHYSNRAFGISVRCLQE